MIQIKEPKKSIDIASCWVIVVGESIALLNIDELIQICAQVSRFRRMYRLAGGSKRKKIDDLKKRLVGLVVSSPKRLQTCS